MKIEVIEKLFDINNRFYQSFGAAFAETRRRIQPGVQRIIKDYIQSGDWLDIGCGSGALGQQLANSGMRGSYLGLDFSEPLLKEARQGSESLGVHSGFDLAYEKINLLDENWCVPYPANTYNGVLAFAVLHHIPGRKNRQRIIRQAAGLIQKGGLLIHSEWQFQNSEKLLARVQPWSCVDLSDAEVEAGDVLLDWRRQTELQEKEKGLRYVHRFSRQELAELAAECRLVLVEEFESDGAGGNLGLYQVWKKES